MSAARRAKDTDAIKVLMKAQASPSQKVNSTPQESPVVTLKDLRASTKREQEAADATRPMGTVVKYINLITGLISDAPQDVDITQDMIRAHSAGRPALEQELTKWYAKVRAVFGRLTEERARRIASAKWQITKSERSKYGGLLKDVGVCYWLPHHDKGARLQWYSRGIQNSKSMRKDELAG